MTEFWTPAFSAENYYEVSDLGRVRSKITGRLYRASMRPNGYLSIRLVKPKPRTFLLHRLVLQSFKGENARPVNHKNGIKDDCRLSNLEFVTPRENTEHAIKTGLFNPRAVFSSRQGELHWNSKLTRESISAIEDRLNSGDAPTDIAAAFGVSKWAIYNIKYKRRWAEAR